MRIAMLGTFTHASVERLLARAFRSLGHECIEYDAWRPPKRWLQLRYWNLALSLPAVRHEVRPVYLRYLNEVTSDFLRSVRPDIVVTHNDAKLLPSTIRMVREQLRAPIASIVADDPTTAVYLPEYLPLIPHFSHLLVPETFLVEKLRPLTSGRVEFLPFGTDPDMFRPAPELVETDRQFVSDIGFVSNSYRAAPYGMYRALFMTHLVNDGLKIYGDRGWKYICKYLPELRPAIAAQGYLGSRDMNLFYNSIKINVNIPNPQIVTGIAQRILDAAAAGCFQVTPLREDIARSFPDECVATFSTMGEMVEKVRYYLREPGERAVRAARARDIVLRQFTWKTYAEKVLAILGEDAPGAGRS